MKTKKCHVEPAPEPPPPDPCKLQRIRQKEKAGIKICPPVPIEQPPPPPTCHALCFERIKNPEIQPSNQTVVCIVERQPTGTARCDEVEERAAAHPDLPWPGCPQPPPLPPPPAPDLCEEQQKKQRIEECKERMKRYRL